MALALGDGTYATARLSALRALRARALAEQLATFGAGLDGLYRIGPHPELLGRSVSDLVVEPSRSAGVSLTGPMLLNAVDRRSDLAPTWVQGRLTGAHGENEDLAIAVGGYRPRVVGLLNFAASIGTFSCTSPSWKTSRPSSHVRVQRNGILIPPTSR